MFRRSFLSALPLLLFSETAPATAVPIDRLRPQIERITRLVNANWGIYIKCLETSEEVVLNALQQMEYDEHVKIPRRG